jgi:hypothetical protein
MHLDLSGDESAALTKELDDITRNDRYPFSERIRTLKAILAKVRTERVREPLPPPRRFKAAHPERQANPRGIADASGRECVYPRPKWAPRLRQT